MKKIVLLILVWALYTPTFAQFTTGTVTLTTGMSIKIDTDATTATMTLIGPSNTWLGIGFGGTSMSSASDMFIWSSSTTNRDYTSTGQSTPSPDASQSWTIVSDNVAASSRTIVATRALVSSGDFTFTNSTSSISIIYALSNSITLGQHTGTHSSRSLTRSVLGVQDLSLNTATIYPNPSNGDFVINSKSIVSKVNVYTQTGAFVKTIQFEGNATSAEINLKGLSTGVYLIELQSDSDKAWKKIIIQ